ncbi:MAG: Nif3-like dinuclear metal center hexameric protein [Lachnospiraceae bacterium]|nr:Nif3-like dinuclear metal center hexameric protein [Lachnospiraceae bacterium]
MKCSNIMDSLEELSPVSYAEEWDNVGLIVGRKDKEIRKVYIAVDPTDEVIQCAIEVQADMIITHHPLIFRAVKKINSEDFIARRVLRLARHDICYYAMHTNFDVMGMADAAADEIGLKRRSVLSVTYEDDIAKEGFGRIGKLPGVMTLKECAEHVKKCFKLKHVRVYGDLETELETAAICPGSGKSMINDAVMAGADVYITGDIEHHEGLDSVAQGLMVIDAGHYGIEKIFIQYIKEYLRRNFHDLAIYTHRDIEPFVVI